MGPPGAFPAPPPAARGRASASIPGDGLGIGLRTVHFPELWRREGVGVDFFEAITENFLGGAAPALANLDRARELAPIVLHGVSLNLLGPDPLDFPWLARVKALADRVDAPWVTDHLCWTGAHGRSAHDLLPFPMTDAAVRYAAYRARVVQDVLERPFGLENLSPMAAFGGSTWDEADFYHEVVARAGVGCLVDVNNIYVSTRNLGGDPERWLAAVEPGRVLQVHVAGHRRVVGGPIVDTHDEPVHEEVWALYAEAWRRFGPFPTLLEWDDSIPCFERCVREVEEARRRRAPSGPPHRRPAPTPAPPPADAPPGLVRWQQAFLETVTRPLAWVPPRARAEVGPLAERLPGGIVSDARATAAARLTAYNEQYWFRLLGNLQKAYPTLARLLGLWSFNQLASAFLEARPPAHWDLGRAADDLPGFLPGTAWDTPAHREAALADAAWKRVFEAPATASWSPAPAERAGIHTRRLLPSPTLARLPLQWPMPALRSLAVDLTGEATLELPAPDPGVWLLFRTPALEMSRMRAEPALADLLAALDEAPLGEALARVQARHGARHPDLPARVRRWFDDGVRWGWWTGTAPEGPP